MNSSEKESLLKNFILFFLLLEIMLSIIFLFFYIDKKKDIIINKLYENDYELYSFYPIPHSKKYLLKVSYTIENFQKDLKNLQKKIFTTFIFASFIIMGISFFLTLYTLKPIREALHINQEFIKDILHDFNTPISAMMINLVILKQKCTSPYIDRIEQSINTIVSLQENLKHFLKNIKSEKSNIECNSLLRERIDYFKSLYPDLSFTLIEKNKLIINTQKELFIRIIDNILSNACKYNKKNGYINVIIDKDKLIIEDSGKGIKNSKRVFDRFYKESDRGIGIGLSIVKKLCDELDIKIKIESEVDKGTKVYLYF